MTFMAEAMAAQSQKPVSGNPMREIRVAKVTVNMGVGQTGEELKKAETIMQRLTNMKPLETICKDKNPSWNIRPGLTIGCKVTLRDEPAVEFLKRALQAKENKLNRKCFDLQGNFGFGVKEYIDMPSAKYDPKLGIRGFDVLVTLERPGYRIKRRKLAKKKVTPPHLISKDDAVGFVSSKFGVEIK